MPSGLAASKIGVKRSIDSAIEQLMFRWENPSEAAPNTATSRAPAATAASKPFMFGVSTGKLRPPAAPAMVVRPAMISAWSAICGTHLGDTKDVTSMSRRPVATRRRISSSLVPVATFCFSFCSPSRGPISTMRTLSFMVMPPSAAS